MGGKLASKICGCITSGDSKEGGPPSALTRCKDGKSEYFWPDRDSTSG